MEAENQSILTINDTNKYKFLHTLHGAGYTYVEVGEVLRLINELRLALEAEKGKHKSNE
jgi:hypothetical protein